MSLDSQAVELDVAERKMIHKISTLGKSMSSNAWSRSFISTPSADTATLKETLDIANETGFSGFRCSMKGCTT